MESWLEPLHDAETMRAVEQIETLQRQLAKPVPYHFTLTPARP